MKVLDDLAEINVSMVGVVALEKTSESGVVYFADAGGLRCWGELRQKGL